MEAKQYNDRSDLYNIRLATAATGQPNADVFHLAIEVCARARARARAAYTCATHQSRCRLFVVLASLNLLICFKYYLRAYRWLLLRPANAAARFLLNYAFPKRKKKYVLI